MASGVATRPIADLRCLCRPPEPLRLPLRLHHEADVRGGQEGQPSASIYAEGEDERVLRAAQVVLEEGMAGRS